jgi:hypothetical protein
MVTMELVVERFETMTANGLDCACGWLSMSTAQ